MTIPSIAVRFVLPVSTLLVFSLGACNPDPASSAGGGAAPPTPVETVPVQVRAILDEFQAVGSIEAGDQVEIVAEIEETLQRLTFQEGGVVRRGDVLARLDDIQLSAELRRAEALRDQTQAAYERVKRVVELGAGAPQDLDDAAASLKVAEANVQLAAARLGKTLIRAPFSGLVGARRVSAGAFLRPGQAITDLTKIDEVRVRFSVPERFMGRLQAGSSVEVTTTAHPDNLLTGRIDFVEPTLDPSTRSARVVARVQNPGGLLRPGMSANVSAVLGERAMALTVPNEAVFVSGSDNLVFALNDDSTVVRTAITLGTRLADVVEVVSGLSAGQLVVRAGQQKLRDGIKVLPFRSPVDSTAG